MVVKDFYRSIQQHSQFIEPRKLDARAVTAQCACFLCTFTRKQQQQFTFSPPFSLLPQSSSAITQRVYYLGRMTILMPSCNFMKHEDLPLRVPALFVDGRHEHLLTSKHQHTTCPKELRCSPCTPSNAITQLCKVIVLLPEIHLGQARLLIRELVLAMSSPGVDVRLGPQTPCENDAIRETRVMRPSCAFSCVPSPRRGRYPGVEDERVVRPVR